MIRNLLLASDISHAPNQLVVGGVDGAASNLFASNAPVLSGGYSYMQPVQHAQALSYGLQQHPRMVTWNYLDNNATQQQQQRLAAIDALRSSMLLPAVVEPNGAKQDMVSLSVLREHLLRQAIVSSCVPTSTTLATTQGLSSLMNLSTSDRERLLVNELQRRAAVGSIPTMDASNEHDHLVLGPPSKSHVVLSDAQARGKPPKVQETLQLNVTSSRPYNGIISASLDTLRNSRTTNLDHSSERPGNLSGPMPCVPSSRKKRVLLKSETNPTSTKPKRPLSAYNIFFKEERVRVLDRMTEERRNQGHEKDTSKKVKISFEELAKIVAGRWRDLEPSAVAYYKDKAGTDMQRYKKEMQCYKIEMEENNKRQLLKKMLDQKDDQNETVAWTETKRQRTM